MAERARASHADTVRDCSATSSDVRHAGRRGLGCRAAVRDFTGWQRGGLRGRRREGHSALVSALGAVDARVLPGTEDATFPFWSPDSRSVGFFADTKLKKIRVDGGPRNSGLRRGVGTRRYMESRQRRSFLHRSR